MKRLFSLTLMLVFALNVATAQINKEATSKKLTPTSAKKEQIKAEKPAKKKATLEAISDNKKTVEPVNGAKMTFEAVEVDYGTIAQNSDPLRKFNFVNDGTEPLIIKNAKGSCGCTVPSYPKQPILPSESGVIEVRYDTKRVGPFRKTVRLTTNASSKPIVLTIKGKVEKPAPPAPGVPTNDDNILMQGGK